MSNAERTRISRMGGKASHGGGRSSNRRGQSSNSSRSGFGGRRNGSTNCATCHQANGEGVPGAFPPLKNSPVVTGGALELYVTIIMKVYDPRPEYATMPALGENAGFTAEDVAAIINHERSSWGNNSKKITVEEVQVILDKIK